MVAPIGRRGAVARLLAWVQRHRGLAVAIAIAVIVFAAAWQLLLGLSAVIGVALLALTAAVAWAVDRPARRKGAPRSAGRLGFAGVAGAVLVAIAIQAVPYGRSHELPPVTGEPAWDRPVTRELAVLACFDCHSNEVVWPWYSNVAPFSWAVQRHVDAGRDKLNFSEWDRPQRDAHEAAETVEDGSMPPFYFLIAHPGARLSSSAKQDLIRGLEATLGTEDGAGRPEGDD